MSIKMIFNKDPHVTKNQAGITLLEMMIASSLGMGILAALFMLFDFNGKQTMHIKSQAELRNMLTLSVNQVGRQITKAGYGTKELESIVRNPGPSTDTLVIYQNLSEIKSTLSRDAVAGTKYIFIVSDSGFKSEAYIGFTFSGVQEIHKIDDINSAGGDFLIEIRGVLANTFLTGEPNIYPIDKFKLLADSADNQMYVYKNDQMMSQLHNVSAFKVNFRKKDGTITNNFFEIASLNYAITGKYKEHQQNLNLTISSTVIPRNRS